MDFSIDFFKMIMNSGGKVKRVFKIKFFIE